MKKLLLLTVSIALLRVPGSAAPCMTGTLASYIAMPTPGCELGNLTVSGFAYKASAGGGAGEITADLRGASRPVKARVPNITYHVNSTVATLQVQQVRLDGNGFKAGMFGSVEVNEALATLAATRGLQVYLMLVVA